MAEVVVLNDKNLVITFELFVAQLSNCETSQIPHNGLTHQ